MIKGPPGNVDAAERLRGYRKSLRAASADMSTELEIGGDFNQETGFRRAQDVLRLRPLPTAVFAANDNMAIGLISALGNAGVRVPEDMAVTGFDDIPLAQYQSPPLTTVSANAYELGERAVRQWFAANRSDKAEGAVRHEVLPTKLIIRRSCGADASRLNQERADNVDQPLRDKNT